jgi:phosphatidylinositol-3-phosphatase
MAARICAALTFVALMAGCSSSGSSAGTTPFSPTTPPAPVASSTAPAPSSPASPGPRWKHVVVLVMENRDSTSIIGNAQAPYLNQLAHAGMNLTDMHAETHPSQPNYVALLSGSTQGLTNDSCPHTFAADNLAHQLRIAGFSFVGYSEHLPAPGYTGCNAYPYARRHAPWVDFSDLPASVNQPLSAMPTDFNALPTVAFVVPDVTDDMHDGTIAQGDAWVHRHLSAYVAWAREHDSMLIVTWDENEGAPGNRIATMAVGDGIAAGTWTTRADHYSLLRTLEDSFGLRRLGSAATATPVGPLG